MNTDPKARDLFIVDNSISGWTGLRYCVVVKMGEAGAFVLTAYLTDRVKKGERLWPNRKDT